MPTYARVVFLPSVARTVEALGYSSRKLFGKFALSVEQVQIDQGVIPATTYLRLLEEAARYTGQPCFGVPATINEPLTMPGALGYLAQSQSSLEEAWRAVAPYHGNVLSYKTGGLERPDGRTALWCRLNWPEQSEAAQSSLRTAAYMLKLLRYFCGAEEKDFQLFLPAYLADRAGELEKQGIDASFSGDRIVVSVPRDVAQRTRPDADPVLADILAGFLELSRRAPVQDLLIAHIEEEIRNELHNGGPSIEQVAERLGTGVRTLQRRLQRHGEVFSDIVDRCRYRLAQHYIHQNEISIGEIASLLGYANQSAFTRAFLRWSGTTPRDYRMERY